MKLHVDAFRAGAAGLLAAGMLAAAHRPALAQFAVPAPPITPQPLFDFGRTLQQNGIYLYGLDVNHVAGLVGGGLQHGSVFNGELLGGVTFDLQTMAGLQGSSFHVNIDERYGPGITPYAGMLYGLEANVGPQPTFRLSGLYWEQTFANNQVNVLVGRTQPGFDFDVSDFGCEFVNGTSCSQPNAWLYDDNVIPYPASTWGTRINVNFAHHIYARVGAYQEQPYQLVSGQHGFTFGTEDSDGVAIPFEVGYQTTLFNADYPSKYTVGGLYDTGSYTDPHYAPPATKNGRSAFYMVLEQTVWRPYPHSPQYLSLFGGVYVGTGGFQVFRHEIYAGLYARGPFQFRPYDSLGFQAGYVTLDKLSGSNYATESVLEAFYGINIASGVTMKPYMQYVIHPDGIGYESEQHPSNAVVLGFQVNIDLNTGLGLPFFIPH